MLRTKVTGSISAIVENFPCFVFRSDKEPVLQVHPGREVHGRVRLVPLHGRPQRLVHQPVLRDALAASLRHETLRRRVLLNSHSDHFAAHITIAV